MSNKISSTLVYDFDAIKDFIFVNDDRTSDVEITETQKMNQTTNKLETESKTIREVKSNDSSRQTLRYDMIKMFMDILDNVEIDQDIAPLSLGQQMVLNSMISYGLIKEIKE